MKKKFSRKKKIRLFKEKALDNINAIIAGILLLIMVAVGEYEHAFGLAVVMGLLFLAIILLMNVFSVSDKRKRILLTLGFLSTTLLLFWFAQFSGRFMIRFGSICVIVVFLQILESKRK